MQMNGMAYKTFNDLCNLTSPDQVAGAMDLAVRHVQSLGRTEAEVAEFLAEVEKQLFRMLPGHAFGETRAVKLRAHEVIARLRGRDTLITTRETA